MNALSLRLLVAAAVFGCVCAQEDNDDTRIIGGVNAANRAYPYQVLLQSSDSRHVCGGAILDNRWILTAAHCTKPLAPSYVMVGSVTLNSTGWRYVVSKIIAHPEFNATTLVNDIGLIKTNERIVFNDYVKPIPIATDTLPIGTLLTATGWGVSTWPGSEVPNQLQTIDLPIYNQTLCATRWSQLTNGITIQPTMLCVLKQAGQGLCKTDSGGPLVRNGKLYGIVSFGKPCATGEPDVATRVLSYQFWVLFTMATNIF